MAPWVRDLSLHLALLLLVSSPAIVTAGGIFELRIEKFQLDENFPAEKCCPESDGEEDRSFTFCLAKCQFLIGVCLDTYQGVWTAERQPECPLGHKIVPLPLRIRKQPLINISFPVASTWQENFTLIMDILHDSGESNPPKLLFRLPSNEVNFTSYHHWKVKSFGSRSQSPFEKNHAQMLPTQRGIGLSVLTTFSFNCAPGYLGPLCEKECDLGSSPIECGNVESLCPQGYRGPHCDIPICTKPCQNGDCIDPDTCRCHQGWMGEDCSVCQVYPGCKHGSCSLDPETNRQVQFTCSCDEGWGGMLCDIDLQFCQNNKGVCKNSGKCENAMSPNGQPYRCVCAPGYRGDHCEMIQLDCLIHGCRNGGQCTQHMDGQSRCMCPKGYYGNLCEFNQTVCSEDPCQAPNSVCHPLPHPKSGRQFYCACPPGYTGNNCEINIDDCASKPCQNGAFCEDLISSYRCICPAGFSGVWCENRLIDCPPGTCPPGSTCYKTSEGAFGCLPKDPAESHSTNFSPASGSGSSSGLSNSSGNSSAPTVTAAEPLTSDRSNIVMVHLQPSFLSLTIGIPVAVALSGLVLAVAICLFMAACLWRREKRQSPRKPSPSLPQPHVEEDANAYASETSTIWSAYEPLNSLRSKETTLSRLSVYPKAGKGKQHPVEASMIYDQQRYCEAPMGGVFQNNFSLADMPEGYEEGKGSGPTLPPRPQRIAPILAYPPTFLRPVIYPLFAASSSPSSSASSNAPQHRFMASPAPDLNGSDSKRRKDTIVYAIIRHGETLQGMCPSVLLKEYSAPNVRIKDSAPQLALPESSHQESRPSQKQSSNPSQKQ